MARYARRPSGPPRRIGPYKCGPLPTLGIVGGIGAGKSAVAALLAARGARVLDADAIGHALLDQSPSRDEVLGRFGKHLLVAGDKPAIDRRALGEIVFKDAVAREHLEEILHPRIRRTVERAILKVCRRPEEVPLIVLDAPTLYEAGWDDLCDHVVYVDAPREVRLERIGAARGWDDEALGARERAQMDLGEKRRRADLCLTNDGDRDALEAAIDEFWAAAVKPLPRRLRPDHSLSDPDR